MKFQPNYEKRSGFTLVELLVVISIIAILLSVAAVGIQNIDKGQATVSATAQAQGLMDEARSLAIGRSTRARLCIHADSGDPDRYLRFAVVAYEEIERDETGEETGRSWRVDSRGTFFPNGVYFHPRLANQAGQQVSGLGSFGENGSGVRFPGEGVRNPSYYYWEFNAEGLCTVEGASDSGAPFVVCRGALPAGASEPRVIGKDAAGFIIWRNGRSSPIRDTSLIIN